MNRTLKAEVKKIEDKFVAVASTETLDRHGEKVSQDGWDLKSFKKNPVILWSHDHFEPAIGLAKNLKIQKIKGKKALTFEPEFHGKTGISYAAKQLFPDILNSFSVGFLGKEKEAEKFTSQELLEISLVNVPANAEARVLMSAKSLKPEDKVRLEEALKYLNKSKNTPVKERVESLEGEVEKLNKQLKKLKEEKKTIAAVETTTDGTSEKSGERSNSKSLSPALDLLKAANKRLIKALHEFEKAKGE